MNWHRIKTLAKVLVFVSILLPVFYGYYHLNVWNQYLADERTIDAVRAETASEMDALFLLLNNFLVPVMFFGVVLWVIAAKKLRRHTVNPRLEFDVDS